MRKFVALGAFLLAGFIGHAQPPLALVPVDSAKDGGVKVAGAIEVSNGHAVIGSSGSVTAGDRTATVLLPGKGELRVCSTTTVHLSRDRSVSPAGEVAEGPVGGPAAGRARVAAERGGSSTSAEPKAQSQSSGALMMALDRGALEASFATGKYSDVLMTPDFRILISGPGSADVRVRVSPQGDTCVENRGDHAPYLTVSSQLEDGVYRVQPNQRVLFEHGSLHEVVDHESEPCGCPAPPVSIASAGAGGAGDAPAKVAPFPLAESEGLAPVPPPTSQMAVAPGETQTQVTVPLAYNGAAPPVPAAGGADATTAGPSPNQPVSDNRLDAPRVPAPGDTESLTTAASNSKADASMGASGPEAQPVAERPKTARASNGVFHRIGRFFSRLFGR